IRPLGWVQSPAVVLAFDDDPATHVANPGDVAAVLRARLDAPVDPVVVEADGQPVRHEAFELCAGLAGTAAVPGHGSLAMSATYDSAHATQPTSVDRANALIRWMAACATSTATRGSSSSSFCSRIDPMPRLPRAVCSSIPPTIRFA